jgi:hypothetical protein
MESAPLAHAVRDTMSLHHLPQPPRPKQTLFFPKPVQDLHRSVNNQHIERRIQHSISQILRCGARTLQARADYHAWPE